MTKNLTLGYAGEYGARAMTIDLYEEATLWPDATPKLLLCRPGEDAPYVFEGTTYENSCLTFTPRKVDTAIAGTGYAQVYFYGADGALLGKSGLMTTLILRAMSGDVTQEPSAEQKSYYDNLMEQVALAVAAGQTAPGYAQSAAESAAAAAAAQEAAEAAASSVTITTDEINAAGNAALSAIEQKRASALADIPDDYTALYGDVSTLKDQKANVIMDTSARAASHSLHAQDGPLAVTLYGKTTETGSGDKSPDNPYVISGVDVARVHAGGKNLFSSAWESGTLNTTTGAEVSNADRARTADLAPVSPGFTYSIYRSTPGTALSLAGYDSQGKFIGMGSSGKVVTVLVGSSNTNPMNGTRDGCTIKIMPGVYFLRFIETNVNIETLEYTMVEGSTIPTAYEPYAANVITPPLLPDGAPLHGNGTVDDTVENDVLSGCNVKAVFDGSDDEGWWMDAAGVFKRVGAIHPYSDSQHQYSNWIPFAGTHASASPRFKITGDGAVYIVNSAYSDVSELKNALAANPLTVYYRSTAYTPDKDLRVCKTVRNFNKITLTGTEAVEVTDNGTATQMFRIPLIKYTISPNTTAATIYCNMYRHVLWDASPWNVDGSISYEQKKLLRIKDTRFTTAADFKAYLSDLYAAGTPVEITYQLGTPETYMTDPLPLRKPTGIMPVTVTGSGETAVEYPHETKHYIDSQIAAAVALALGN